MKQFQNNGMVPLVTRPESYRFGFSHVSHGFLPVTSLHCRTLHYTGYTDIPSIFRQLGEIVKPQPSGLSPQHLF